MQKVKEVLLPSAIASLSSVLIYKYIIGDSLEIEIPVLGSELPAYAVIGGVTFLGNLGGEVISDMLKDKIPQQPGFLKNLEGGIVTPLISGLTTYTIMRYGISEFTKLPEAVFVTAAGSIAGKYAVKMM